MFLSLCGHLSKQVVQIVLVELIDHSSLRILDDSGSSDDGVIRARGSWKGSAAVEADSGWNVRWIVSRRFHILVWISISASNWFISSTRIFFRLWCQIFGVLFKSLNFLIFFERSLVYLAACLAFDRTFAIELLENLTLGWLLILGGDDACLGLCEYLLPCHAVFISSSRPCAWAQANIYRRLHERVVGTRDARVH